MAKFYGSVGYGISRETPTDSGIWVDDMVEYEYFGDVLRISRELREGESLNNGIFVQNSISIVADQFANENFSAIRYVRWSGTLWTVSKVEVQSPRLILSLGSVYNGPTP